VVKNNLTVSKSRVVCDCNSKKGVRRLLKLITIGRSIAHKYCEGKVKRTLKRELKEHENVMREPNLISKILIRTTYEVMGRSVCF